MLNRFLNFCKQNNLIFENDSILLSVSGGADSIFMVEIFKKIQNTFSLKLGIAYIDHNIRDVKSEIEFVKKISKKHNLPFYYYKISPSRKNLEDLLRIKRLKALKEIAKKNNYLKIALAHTKDDQAETILMRFLKGTSLRGLSGIKPISEGIFIHPILPFSKEEIINYLKNVNLSFIQDPTNFNFNFLRNKLRHKILPYLEREINPSLKESLVQMAYVLMEDENYLKEKAKMSLNEIFKSRNPFPNFERKSFIDLPDAIKNRILISILKEYNFRWEKKHIDLLKDFIENKPNKTAKFLNKSLTFISTYDNIYICPYDVPPQPFFLKRCRKIKLAGWGSSISLSKKEGEFKIDENMIDKVKLSSINYESNFKKDMKKMKISYPLRNYLPVFAIENKIIWIPGFYKEEFISKNNIFMRWNYELSKNT